MCKKVFLHISRVLIKRCLIGHDGHAIHHKNIKYLCRVAHKLSHKVQSTTDVDVHDDQSSPDAYTWRSQHQIERLRIPMESYHHHSHKYQLINPKKFTLTKLPSSPSQFPPHLRGIFAIIAKHEALFPGALWQIILVYVAYRTESTTVTSQQTAFCGDQSKRIISVPRNIPWLKLHKSPRPQEHEKLLPAPGVWIIIFNENVILGIMDVI